MIKLIEYFNSVQGEGLYSGFPTTFIRLHDCNLRCAFCDTQPWMSAYTDIEPEELIDWLEEMGVLPHICITGGEPLLEPQLPALLKLLDKAYTSQVHIETNASLAVWRPTTATDWPFDPIITVSPKTAGWSFAHLSQGPLERVSDIKFLVDPSGLLFDIDIDDFQMFEGTICLQPVDPGPSSTPYLERIKPAVDRIHSLLEQYSHCALSLQTHKLFNWR